MTTRCNLSALIVVVVGVVALVPLYGATPPNDEGLDPLPVHGAVLPTGEFVGTLRIVACTLDATGNLRLTGVLNGTATQRTGGRMPVTEQVFTVPATLRDPGRTTDVVRLALALIALDPMGFRIRLAPFTVEIETLPGVGDELATRLPIP
jgi:hypothetical protein